MDVLIKEEGYPAKPGVKFGRKLTWKLQTEASVVAFGARGPKTTRANQ